MHFSFSPSVPAVWAGGWRRAPARWRHLHAAPQERGDHRHHDLQPQRPCHHDLQGRGPQLCHERYGKAPWATMSQASCHILSVDWGLRCHICANSFTICGHGQISVIMVNGFSTQHFYLFIFLFFINLACSFTSWLRSHYWATDVKTHMCFDTQDSSIRLPWERCAMKLQFINFFFKQLNSNTVADRQSWTSTVFTKRNIVVYFLVLV